MERIIEKGDEVDVNASAVGGSVGLHPYQLAGRKGRARRDSQPKRNLSEMFQKMSPEELDRCAKTGQLPNWFPTSTDATYADSHGGTDAAYVYERTTKRTITDATIRPADFPLASPESRAAARSIVTQPNWLLELNEDRADCMTLYRGTCYLNAQMSPDYMDLGATAAFARGRNSIRGGTTPLFLHTSTPDTGGRPAQVCSSSAASVESHRRAT